MNKNSKLKVALFEKGTNQETLSAQTGIPRSYISLAINGKFNLNQKQKTKIAKALNLDVKELF